eukprot:6201216-Pleurochrysis_carterae.AAC.1
MKPTSLVPWCMSRKPWRPIAVARELGWLEWANQVRAGQLPATLRGVRVVVHGCVVHLPQVWRHWPSGVAEHVRAWQVHLQCHQADGTCAWQTHQAGAHPAAILSTTGSFADGPPAALPRVMTSGVTPWCSLQMYSNSVELSGRTCSPCPHQGGWTCYAFGRACPDGHQSRLQPCSAPWPARRKPS